MTTSTRGLRLGGESGLRNVVAALIRGEFPVSWTVDGRAMPVKELHPSPVAGIRLSQISVTPDGRSFLPMYSRLVSNL